MGNSERARALLDDIIPGRIVDFDEWRTNAIAAALDEAEARGAGRERAAVVALVRGPEWQMDDLADAIERAEHRKETDGNA
jgi:hypothetical protein